MSRNARKTTAPSMAKENTIITVIVVCILFSLLMGCTTQPAADQPVTHIHVLIVMPEGTTLPYTESQAEAAANETDELKRAEILQRLAVSGQDVWVDGDTNHTLADGNYIAAIRQLLHPHGQHVIRMISGDENILDAE